MPLERRWRRPLLRTACTIIAATLMVATALPAGAVPPPPPNPSDQDLTDSQSLASSTAAAVGRLAGLVTATEGKITRLGNDMELKAELVKKALIDVQVADADAVAAGADAAAAARRAEDAGAAIADAQQKAAAFAAASYRQGSVLGSVTALLDASSAQDLLSREQLLQPVAAHQLNAINQLQVSRNIKVNLDSDARAAQDQAQAAREYAQQSQADAQAAKRNAAAAFTTGQTQLASLRDTLREQNAAYGAALSKAASLIGQRQQYENWLTEKKAEELRLREEAAARARQAAATAARVAAEKVAADKLAAAQAAAARAAQQAAADRRAAATVAAQRAAATRRTAAAAAAAEQAAAQKAAADQVAAQQAAAGKAAALQSAREAQQRLVRQQTAAGDTVYYASCADAQIAGVTPLHRGSPGYRVGLDRNGNGVACETLPDAGPAPAAPAPPAPGPAPAPAPAPVYYSSCAEAELAGAAPIQQGTAGYRSGLDSNGNGIACETVSAPAAPPTTPADSSSGTPVSGGGVAASRDNAGSSSPGGWSADKGQRAVQAAQRWVGTPYSWGGGNSSGPTTGICGPNGAENDCNIVGFDCSGLTSYAWAQVGIDLPSYSVYQYTLGQHISTGDLLAGDFLFYANDTSDPNTIHHVSMYMGNGQMIEAPYSGAYVQIVPVTFGNGYIGATRPGT